MRADTETGNPHAEVRARECFLCRLKFLRGTTVESCRPRRPIMAPPSIQQKCRPRLSHGHVHRRPTSMAFRSRRMVTGHAVPSAGSNVEPEPWRVRDGVHEPAASMASNGCGRGRVHVRVDQRARLEAAVARPAVSPQSRNSVLLRAQPGRATDVRVQRDIGRPSSLPGDRGTAETASPWSRPRLPDRPQASCSATCSDRRSCVSPAMLVVETPKPSDTQIRR